MRLLRVCSLAGLLLGMLTSPGNADEVSFHRDIRPILSAHCFKCHGPDDATRQANVRFDHRDAALAEGDSGARPIIPGKPEESELVTRVFSEDESTMMPPPVANKPLSDAQKKLLKEWIAAGATYEPHWAFVPPVQADLPAVTKRNWPRNPIDHFILAGIEKGGLEPAPEADKYTLARRLHLDLLGLPPTQEEILSFVSDTAPHAYEALVDRLLASPHYGERWARRWLDLVRYADTNGYEKDRARSIWPYRDWVINAINADLPYDQFSIEQLAGDMLPNATDGQRIATGMHRNTMLNEEGGVDPLEFRYYSVVDRNNTTGTIWLGLTVGCAQCHTHKFDPITHRDYYQLMAFLNNADEPEIEVPDAAIAKRRAELSADIGRLEADLVHRFPPEGDIRWHDVGVVEATSSAGAILTTAEDGSIRVSGAAPAEDSYTLGVDVELPRVTALQIEALADPELPNKGPGRTPHGNFVLTEIAASLITSSDTSRDLKFSSATADFAQDGFPPANVFDGDQHTGWAIHGPDPWNVHRTLTLQFVEPVEVAGRGRWTIRLDQKYGGGHTLGRFRIRLGEAIANDKSDMVRRQEHLERKFQAWLKAESAKTIGWKLLKPIQAESDIPSLTIQADKTILASGDQSKRDVYRVAYANDLPAITALRLEVLPDPSLPKNGPGRIAYEGPFGDFFLSEWTVRNGDKKIPFQAATHSFASGKNTAAVAIDGDPQTGWSISGGQGKPHSAVFQLSEPLSGAAQLDLELLFERYYAAGLGKFRVWATDAKGPVAASTLPTEIETALLVPNDDRTSEQRKILLSYFLSVAPELAAEREAIEKLRGQLPSYPTSLVMRERPAEHPRQTFIHKRGEFLQPTDTVERELPSLFPPLATEESRDRLTFAKWLVGERNPLAARVAVNRYWAAFFGRGIVRTTEDFGYQGEAPTHPELLDWLAVEFRQRGWSVKQLHKLIVMSATYRQSSKIAPASLEKDPENKLLSHSPRVRLDAELVRDLLLRVSGLLSEKIGGPSVFPPQPASVTSEGTYGPLEWKVSEGEDRFRRGLYTFSKRTAPYAMFTTFDAPSGEACVARREVSNTPLQALTMLNDIVSIEAAQALGQRLATSQKSCLEGIEDLYLTCLGRTPQDKERELLATFHQTNVDRIARKELDAAKIAGTATGDVQAQAAWTLTARAVLNLDETLTKE